MIYGVEKGISVFYGFLFSFSFSSWGGGRGMWGRRRESCSSGFIGVGVGVSDLGRSWRCLGLMFGFFFRF